MGKICKIIVWKMTICKMIVHKMNGCSLQDDSLQDIDIDTVCKSVKRGSLSLDVI